MHFEWRLWRTKVPAGNKRPQREDNCRESSARIIDVGIAPEEESEIQNTDTVVYIYDGLKRWWADRRTKYWLMAAFIFGLVLGMAIGSLLVTFSLYVMHHLP